MSDKIVGNSLKLIAKSSFAVMIGIFISKIASYLYRILIARQFGPEEYGLLSLAIIILGFFVAISSIGVSDGIGRFVPIFRAKKQTERIKYIISWTFKAVILIGIISGALLFIFAEQISLKLFHNEGLIIYLKMFSFMVPISILSNSFLDLLKAYEHIRWFSFIINVLQNIVKLATLSIFIWFGIFESQSIIFSYVSGILSMFIVGYFICFKKIGKIFQKSSINEISKREIRNEVFKYSVPLLFASIILSLFYWVDTLSLGYLKNFEIVGFYNAAVPIAMLLYFIPEIFMQLFKPMVNRKYGSNDLITIKEISKQVIKWILIITMPLFMLLFVFPGAFLNILFGNEYLVSNNPLRLLSLAALILSLSVVPSNLLLMKGKSNLIFISTLFATIVNIILNFAFIPLPVIIGFENSSGMVGAALATLISVSLMSFIQFWHAKTHTDIFPFRKKTLTIILISICSLITLVLLRKFIILNTVGVVILGFIFIFIYTALVISTNCLDKYDYLIIRGIKNKVLHW